MSLCKRYCASGFVLHLLITVTTSTIGNGYNQTKQRASSNSSVPSIFIFGDSTVDPGNNDFIKTLFRSNFAPYGVDFSDHTPTGRFTNGMLTTDFIASYLGIKQTIPAYLDPNLSMQDLTTGVSFASAGTGYDPATAEKNKVIDLDTQLVYFEEYKKKLQDKVGKKRMEYIIENAAYVVSCGTNDIVYTYGIVDLSKVPDETLSAYLHLMLKECKRFLEGLLNRGARKVGVVGLPPVGCLPIIITLHSSLFQPRICIDSMSSLARDYNQMLQQELTTMQASQQNITVAYGDIYAPLVDQFNNPHKYGLKVVDKGCCGTGLFEGAIACNTFSSVCHNRSAYLFWDAIHPTERSYYLLFEALRPIVDIVIHK